MRRYGLLEPRRTGVASEIPAVLYRDGPDGTQITSTAADADTSFAIASVGKIMTSVAVLRMVARGVLHLDDLAADFIGRTLPMALAGLMTCSCVICCP